MHGVSTIQNVCIDLENDLTYERDVWTYCRDAMHGVSTIQNVCIDLENDLTYERDDERDVWTRRMNVM